MTIFSANGKREAVFSVQKAVEPEGGAAVGTVLDELHPDIQDASGIVLGGETAELDDVTVLQAGSRSRSSL